MLRNERGSLILAMILCIAITLGTVFLMTARSDDAAYYRRVMLWRGIARVHTQNVQTALSSPIAFYKTMKHQQNNTTSFSLDKCLNDVAYNCPAGPHSLTVLAEDGTIISDPNSATAGYDLNGKSCNRFGDYGCLIKMTVTWTPICPASGICNSQKFTIKTTFVKSGLDSTMARTVSVATKDLDLSYTMIP